MKRFARLVVALPVLAAGCVVRNGNEPTTTTLYVYATFANPTVTVKLNGQALGSITRQYTGGDDCPSLSHVVTDGTMLHFTVQLGQTYSIVWDYGNGRTDSDNLPATSDVVESPCLIEPIAAPAP